MYRVGIKAKGEGEFAYSDLRFPTMIAAEGYAKRLAFPRGDIENWRVEELTKPETHQIYRVTDLTREGRDFVEVELTNHQLIYFKPTVFAALLKLEGNIFGRPCRYRAEDDLVEESLEFLDCEECNES